MRSAGQSAWPASAHPRAAGCVRKTEATEVTEVTGAVHGGSEGLVDMDMRAGLLQRPIKMNAPTST